MFDLDYTLLLPSDQFLAPGYQRTGARYGLELDPARWPEAERAAHAAVKERRRQTGAAHDDGLLEVIARAVIGGLGGGGPAAVTATAQAIMRAWCEAENFGLYEDVLPCLRALKGAGARMALVSNAVGHSLEEIVAHFTLNGFVETTLASSDIGLVKPAPEMFATVLARTGVPPSAAVMVGDSVEDDVRGALAYGCGAILLDRAGRFDLPLPTIRSLAELPAALGL
ncbi:MAG: HAD family hydrolase [Thermoleophilia bacterium]